MRLSCYVAYDLVTLQDVKVILFYIQCLHCGGKAMNQNCIKIFWHLLFKYIVYALTMYQWDHIVRWDIQNAK